MKDFSGNRAFGRKQEHKEAFRKTVFQLKLASQSLSFLQVLKQHRSHANTRQIWLKTDFDKKIYRKGTGKCLEDTFALHCNC